MLIHQQLREQRSKAGMSRAELSRRTGIPYSTLGYWEGGDGAPTINECIRISRALRIPIEELISGVTLPEDEA